MPNMARNEINEASFTTVFDILKICKPRVVTIEETETIALRRPLRRAGQQTSGLPERERALELQAFRLVGVADEPSGTGPNGETRKWRQCKAVITEIERLRDQLLTMTIHNEILQSQVNNLEFEKTNLQQQVTRTLTLAVEQEGIMANLGAKNSLLQGQLEAYKWPIAHTNFD